MFYKWKPSFGIPRVCLILVFEDTQKNYFIKFKNYFVKKNKDGRINIFFLFILFNLFLKIENNYKK